MHARMHSCAACPPVARAHAGASARVSVVIECAPGSRAHFDAGLSVRVKCESDAPSSPPSPSHKYGAAEPRRTSR